MADSEAKTIEWLAGEMSRGFELLHRQMAGLLEEFGKVTAGLGSLEGRFAEIESRLAKVEARLLAQDERLGRIEKRLALVEYELSELKERVGVLSRDIILGRTEDAARYKALELRLAAVEERMKS